MEEVQRLYISVDKDQQQLPHQPTKSINDIDDVDQTDDQSFSFIQLFTLGLSSALLCLLPLFSDSIHNYTQKVVITVSLMVALLISRIALQAKITRPQMARRCGFVAVVSLLIALSSLISSSFLRLLSL